MTMTDTAAARADFTEAADRMTAAVNRLSELSRADADLSDMVAALDALAADGGPLVALNALFERASFWLADFDDDDLNLAAERAADAADSIGAARYAAAFILDLARPLAD